MAKATSYKFVARLHEIDAALISTVIYIPGDLMEKLPKSRVRVKGTINGASFALAIQYRKEGRSFLIVSKPLRKAAGVGPGQKVTVEFSIVSDKVELPREMKEVLAQDDQGAKAWKDLTNGLQRSLCHYINSAKSIDVRIKRALYLIDKVKQGAYVKKPATKRSSLPDE
jgi:hypothetical protein